MQLSTLAPSPSLTQGSARTQKWQNLSAGPIQCKRFNQAWSSLNWEGNTCVELTGVIGQSERRCVLTTMGGSRSRADVAEAKQAIGERFGWQVTAQNVNALTQAVNDALVTLQQNRPIEDNRATPDAEAERRAELARTMAEQKAKGDKAAAAFIAHYGSGEKVTLHPGQVAVVARICFNNSDMMTDYFDAHASLSQPFVLAVVPKQAETERLARRGVEVSPLLSQVEFGWHTEKWSMGHGNYLEAKEGFELPVELQGLRSRSGGGEVTRAHWEITFQRAYREPVTLDAIAGYGNIAGTSSTAGTATVATVATGDPTAPAAPAAGATVTENTEKNGLEIRFPSKPAAEVLESLKAAGWRWSRFSQCWYTRRSDAARQFAESLSGEAKASEPAAPATSGKGAQATPGEPRAYAPTAPGLVLAARFRAWADALQPKIDHIGRPMSQNPTPKRNREYQSRMYDCRNMERLQKALRALADGHEAGTVPGALSGLKTRDEVGAKVRKAVSGRGGYYSVIECDDYADTTPAARLMQSMIEGNPAERAERERLRRIEALKAEIALSTIPGYFPTQAPVTAYMLKLARVASEMTFLEPEAGSGHIADAIRAEIPDAQIDCCEVNLRLRELLAFKGHNLVADDFLEWSTPKRYDRIIMNPPFEKQADIDHVRKAYGLLANGGALVSVMAPGFEFRSDRKSAEFREWLGSVGGHVEDLPDGSFKASGTGVNTKLVVIEL